MSSIDTTISNREVIPSISTELFAHNENARFAVGILAVGDQVINGRNNEYTGYLRLRANVYADQAGIINKDQVQEDGTERDNNDSRSVHFAIIENLGQDKRVVAAMRLIVKSQDKSDPLPVEQFFPAAFNGYPAPAASTEVSRYICRHEDGKTQSQLKWPLFSGALSYVMSHDLGPAYGIIEEPLERNLLANGIPLQRLAEPEYLQEYNSVNLPVGIDSAELARKMGLDNPSLIGAIRNSESSFTYFGKRSEALEQAA